MSHVLMYFKFLYPITEKRVTRPNKKHVMKRKYEICDKTFKRVGKGRIYKRFKCIRFKLVNSQTNGRHS